MGSYAGALKAAALKLGISLEEYQTHRASGEKHCRGCDAWMLRSEFNRDRSRSDGYMPFCRSCQHKGCMPVRR